MLQCEHRAQMFGRVAAEVRIQYGSTGRLEGFESGIRYIWGTKVISSPKLAGLLFAVRELNQGAQDLFDDPGTLAFVLGEDLPKLVGSTITE